MHHHSQLPRLLARNTFKFKTRPSLYKCGRQKQHFEGERSSRRRHANYYSTNASLASGTLSSFQPSAEKSIETYEPQLKETNRQATRPNNLMKISYHHYFNKGLFPLGITFNRGFFKRNMMLLQQSNHVRNFCDGGFI